MALHRCHPRRRSTGPSGDSGLTGAMSQDASSKAAELYGQTRAGPVIPDVPRTIRTRPVLNSGPLAPSNCNDVESAVGVLRCVRGALVCTRRAGASGGHDRAGARRTGAPCAAGCRGGPAGLAGPADRASARLAHLLEEPGRLGPADDVDMAVARRRHGRRHRLANTRQAAGRPVDELWLQRQGAVAGTSDRDIGVRRQGTRGQAQRPVAGLQGCVHPAARRLHTQRAGAGQHGPAWRGLRRRTGRGAAGRGRSDSPGPIGRRREDTAGQRQRPAGGAAGPGTGLLCRDRRRDRARRARSMRAGTLGSGTPTYPLRSSASRARHR